MTVPTQMYNFILRSIRDADQKDGHQFFERFFYGPQSVWETIDAALNAIPALWSVTECPDEYLKYLKGIVGWTSELDHITYDLSYGELRRLIAISGRLWKLRGPEDTIIDVIKFATGARCYYLNWFDFRWVLDETGFGEQDDPYNPWIVSAPEEGETGDERVSNLRVVDNGSLNRELVINLVKLMRAAGERWEITYLGFLDRFIEDEDTTQWEVPEDTGDSIFQVSDGVMRIGTTVLEEVVTKAIVDYADWDAFTLKTICKVTSVISTITYFGVRFHQVDDNNYYSLGFKAQSPTEWQIELVLTKVVDGTPSVLQSVALDSFYFDTWYDLTIEILDDIGGKRIRGNVDSTTIVDYTDSSPLAPGTIGYYTIYTIADIKKVELIDYYYQMPFITATFDRDSDAYLLANNILTKFTSDVPAIANIDSRQCVQICRAYDTENEYSEDLDNLFPSKNGIEVSSNVIADPLGSITVDKFIEDDSIGSHETSNNYLSIESGYTYVFSAVFRKSERHQFRWWLGNNTFAAKHGVMVDLETLSIEPYNSPLWYYLLPLMGDFVLVVFAALSTGTGSNYHRIVLMIPDFTTSYQGVSGYGLYCWGYNVYKAKWLPPYIYAGATPGSMESDKLKWSEAKVAENSWVREGFVIDVYPNYSSDQLGSNYAYVFHFDDAYDTRGYFYSNRFYIEHDGIVLSSDAIEWEAFGKLTITIRADYSGQSYVKIEGLIGGMVELYGIAYIVDAGALELGAYNQAEQFDGKISAPTKIRLDPYSFIDINS